jgi:hypothetical protein
VVHQNENPGPARDLWDISNLGATDEANGPQDREGHELLPGAQDGVAAARKHAGERTDDEPLHQIGSNEHDRDESERQGSPDLHDGFPDPETVTVIDTAPLQGGFS